MEAHAGTISVGTSITSKKPRQRRFAQLREQLRQRRLERAARAHTVRMTGISSPSVPGSEYTHLRPRGF